MALLIAQVGYADSFRRETAKAEALRNGTAIRQSYHYCFTGTLTCRTLVLLKDKNTNESVSSFYDVFLSSERAVGSTGYFMLGRRGTYSAFLDQTFDGRINIDLKFEENKKLNVTFDSNGLPTVHDMTLKTLGTTRYLEADMTYTLTEATLIGIEYDSADRNYRRNVNVRYLRVQAP